MKNKSKSLISVLIITSMCISMLAVASFTLEATENNYSEAVSADNFRYSLSNNHTATITDYSGNETALTIPAKLGDYNVTHIGDFAFNELEINNVEPSDNTNYCIDNEALHEYWGNVVYDDNDYSYSRIGEFNVETTYRKDRPTPIKITIHNGAKELYISDNKKMIDCRKVAISSADIQKGYCQINNLIPGKRYFAYEIDANGVITDSTTFIPSGYRRMCYVSKIINVRDFGGLETTDGRRIKYGMLYRGGDLTSISEKGRNSIINELGINAEIDFRNDSEGTTSVLNFTDYCNVQIKPFSTVYKHARPDIENPQNNPFAPLYANAFKQILSWLKDDKTIYMHCLSGADRTGTMSAIVEGILGVSENDITKDYEITSFANRPRSRAIESEKKYYYAEAIEKIKSLEGDTFKDKWRTFLISYGVTPEEIDEFEELMLENIPVPTEYKPIENSLKHITIENGINSIGDYAFYGCKDLESITIPESVNSIGNNTFYGCNSFVIYGYSHSYAEKYAKENSIPFISLNAKPVILGDVDMDGVIRIQDATLIQRYLAKIADLNEEQLTAAKVISDEKLSVNDATILQRYLAEIIDRFPIENNIQ